MKKLKSEKLNKLEFVELVLPNCAEEIKDGFHKEIFFYYLADAPYCDLRILNSKRKPVVTLVVNLFAKEQFPNEEQLLRYALKMVSNIKARHEYLDHLVNYQDSLVPWNSITKLDPSRINITLSLLLT